MRTFILIWFGQLVSAIGTYMTFFALTLWAWDQTGSATALALIGFFLRLPKIPITLFAGVIIDRFNRKYLMLLGDIVAALSTVTVGILYITHQLNLWHLYIIIATAGGFGQIQALAYQASVAMIVPKNQYTRVGSMAAIVHYGSNIIGPALAGVLYPTVGVPGIILIDLITFTIAFITLIISRIPNPEKHTEPDNLFSRVTLGFRYIWQQPGLKSLLLVTILFTFVHDMGAAIQRPMVLARTNGSAQAVASIFAVAGIGGVTGAIAISAWGGPKRHINGVLGGYIGAGLSKTIFGLGQSLTVWLPAQLSSSLNFPLLSSTRSALWMGKVIPSIQGRVFAANDLVIQGVSAGAVLLAGPLADQILEPAMAPNKPLTHLFTGFGSGPGAGMAVLYTLCALLMVFAGLLGFFIPSLRSIKLESKEHY